MPYTDLAVASGKVGVEWQRVRGQRKQTPCARRKRQSRIASAIRSETPKNTPYKLQRRLDPFPGTKPSFRAPPSAQDLTLIQITPLVASFNTLLIRLREEGKGNPSEESVDGAASPPSFGGAEVWIHFPFLSPAHANYRPTYLFTSPLYLTHALTHHNLYRPS